MALRDPSVSVNRNFQIHVAAIAKIFKYEEGKRKRSLICIIQIDSRDEKRKKLAEVD